MRMPSCVLGALIAVGPMSAAAEVTAASEDGFVSHNEAQIAASVDQVWRAMLKPGDWWNGEHTYSGSAGNLTIAPAAGGCFCETVPGKDGAPDGQVEHLRVIYLAPGSTLRMTGGLGPLQSEAVTGVLTITLEPAGNGTKIAWDYVVGGYMRTPMTELAPVVDRVVGEQLARLAARFAEH